MVRKLPDYLCSTIYHGMLSPAKRPRKREHAKAVPPGPAIDPCALIAAIAIAGIWPQAKEVFMPQSGSSGVCVHDPRKTHGAYWPWLGVDVAERITTALIHGTLGRRGRRRVLMSGPKDEHTTAGRGHIRRGECGPHPFFAGLKCFPSCSERTINPNFSRTYRKYYCKRLHRLFLHHILPFI